MPLEQVNSVDNGIKLLICYRNYFKTTNFTVLGQSLELHHNEQKYCKGY